MINKTEYRCCKRTKMILEYLPYFSIKVEQALASDLILFSLYDNGNLKNSSKEMPFINT